MKPMMGIYRAPKKRCFLNYSNRKKGSIIDMIILHYTEFSYEKSFSTLSVGGNVSSHFLIREDGRIDDLVPMRKKAWHAGKSYWDRREAINDYSIGIEIVNSGMENIDSNFDITKIPDFTKKQYDAISELITYIKLKFPEIKEHYILGHSDITAIDLRKKDPGIKFDWKKLSEFGHGLHSDILLNNNYTMFKKGEQSHAIKELKHSLASFGYEVDYSNDFNQQLANVIFAFNLHFNQREFIKNSFNSNIWSNNSDQRLKDLLKKKQSHD